MSNQASVKTSIFSNALIWFGAGVSIAEILTGTYFATLGFAKGILAVIIGHIIGGLMMFAAGVIGGREEKSAMETVGFSFGSKGKLFFALMNVLQLVGWTAIMIYDGAIAANGIFAVGSWIWALVIGALILVWIFIGITNLGKINTVAMLALLVLTLILCKVLFFGEQQIIIPMDESLSFGAAVELAVAMPLSWLPLISDYTREASKPVKATAVSVVVYSLVSCFMYIIGMGAAIYTGEYDISQIMVKAGIGIAGLLIIIFSTVTTTFLDAYSAGVSSISINEKLSEKWAAIVVVVIGTIAAIAFPMDDITPFLYLIGSIFAPMIAIQIADYFILKKGGFELKGVNTTNIIIWAIGFILYHILMGFDSFILSGILLGLKLVNPELYIIPVSPVGYTLPDMVITIIICVAVDAVRRNKKDKKKKAISPLN